MKDKLYLLRPGFEAGDGATRYCSDSAPVEGVLSFFPQLRDLVEVQYLAFPRPRETLVSALGEAYQSLPVLIVAPERILSSAVPNPETVNGSRYFAEESSIRQYLSAQYGLPQPS